MKICYSHRVRLLINSLGPKFVVVLTLAVFILPQTSPQLSHLLPQQGRHLPSPHNPPPPRVHSRSPSQATLRVWCRMRLLCKCSPTSRPLQSAVWGELQQCRVSIIKDILAILLPRAHMREAGLSNQFCPSVCLSSVCQAKKIEISPHRPSKWSQTIANSKKLLYVYLTEVKALRFAVFRLFPTFHNYS